MYDEYLLETRVLTSADFNTYPVRNLLLTHIIQKDLTKNASGQITDHYDLPQNPSVLSWR